MESNQQKQILKLLVEELDKRKLKNPAFSLRAFAKQLDLGAGPLSQMLSGKRPISLRTFEKIADKLMISPDKIANITEQKTVKDLVKYNIPEKNFLPMDEYKIVAEWQHYVILSLSETDDFQSDEKWIANRLQTSERTVSESLKTLEQLGYISRDKSKKIKLLKPNLQTTRDISNMALRRRHHEALEAGQQALQAVPVELREFAGMVMAIDIKKLPKAKEMIREFMNKLSVYLENDNKNEVYEIAIQLFPRTKTKENPYEK
jgi:uncharacterized protein (TIGR02147 family)